MALRGSASTTRYSRGRLYDVSSRPPAPPARRCRAPLGADDEGDDRLAPFRRGDADHGDLGDRWMAAQDGLHLGRVDVVAPRDDELGAPTPDGEIAVVGSTEARSPVANQPSTHIDAVASGRFQ